MTELERLQVVLEERERARVALRGDIPCRSCGCTDEDCSRCMARTGRPCHWVEWDQCSACAQLERFLLLWWLWSNGCYVARPIAAYEGS